MPSSLGGTDVSKREESVPRLEHGASKGLSSKTRGPYDGTFVQVERYSGEPKNLGKKNTGRRLNHVAAL